jgi:hypothetical protein
MRIFSLHSPSDLAKESLLDSLRSIQEFSILSSDTSLSQAFNYTITKLDTLIEKRYDFTLYFRILIHNMITSPSSHESTISTSSNKLTDLVKRYSQYDIYINTYFFNTIPLAIILKILSADTSLPYRLSEEEKDILLFTCLVKPAFCSSRYINLYNKDNLEKALYLTEHYNGTNPFTGETWLQTLQNLSLTNENDKTAQAQYIGLFHKQPSILTVNSYQDLLRQNQISITLSSSPVANLLEELKTPNTPPIITTGNTILK